jgi:hypothetical protein
MIVNFLHLRKHLTDGVPHALSGAASAAGYAAHVVEGQAFGATRQRAGKLKDLPGPVIPHVGCVRF